MPFAETRLDLEISILSEVSQRKTNIIDIAYIWNPNKIKEMNCLQSRNRLTDIEHKIMLTKGDAGEG